MEEAYDQMKSFRKNKYWGNVFFHPSKLIKEQAEDEGFEQGQESKTLEIVLSMIDEKIPYETISKVTGLTIDEITKLANSD